MFINPSLFCKGVNGENRHPLIHPTIPPSHPPSLRSLTGNVLAVSSGDQKVILYKQRLNGEWAAWEETQGGGEGWKKVDSAAGPPPTATGTASPALASS